MGVMAVAVCPSSFNVDTASKGQGRVLKLSGAKRHKDGVLKLSEHRFTALDRHTQRHTGHVQESTAFLAYLFSVVS
jgi:hypothetical protein